MRRYALYSFMLAATTAAPSGFAGGMQQLDINDPVLRMHAFSLSAPAGWTMAGAMVQGSSCNSAVSPVYRLASPDGLTGVYLQPRLDWAWSSDSRPQAPQSNDCMPWRNVTARQLLAYTIGVLNVGYVRDLATPDLAQFQRGNAALNAKSRGSMTFYGDEAAALVSYELNGQRIDERLDILESCNEAVVLGPGTRKFNCSMFVRRDWAPSGKLEQTLPLFQAITGSERFDQQWNEAWNAFTTRRIQQYYQGQTQVMLAQGERAQAQRMRAHQDYMNVQRRGADMNTNRFKERQYVKQKVSDDRVDFLLDCQRFPDGTTVGNCPNRQTSAR